MTQIEEMSKQNRNCKRLQDDWSEAQVQGCTHLIHVENNFGDESGFGIKIPKETSYADFIDAQKQELVGKKQTLILVWDISEPNPFN